MNQTNTLYSEKGLKKLIHINEQKLKEKRMEYNQASIKFSPIFAEGIKCEIKKEMEHINRRIERFKKQLKEIENTSNKV